MKKILLLAAFIYFFLAPLTYHPDNKQVLSGASLNHGRVWNIWDYQEKNHPNQDAFVYPPLHFYLDKLQYALALPLGGAGFHDWLAAPTELDPFQPSLVRYTFALKFGLILFGLATGFVIYRLALQEKLSETQAQIAASLWLFNPIVIYSVPIMGQNDVMAILFFLLGWYALGKSKWLAGILFGLGTSIKMFPLLWLPFLLASIPKYSFKYKATVMILCIIVYVVTLLPFIANASFRSAVLGSNINSRFFIAQIGLGFSETINLMPILFILVFMAVLSYRPTKKDALSWPSFVLITLNLQLLGFSHFHPQWFTWLIPFWALWLTKQGRDHIWLLLGLSVTTWAAWLGVVILFQDASVSYGLLVPLNPFFSNFPSLHDYLTAHDIDVFRYTNYAHTWIAAMGTVALITLFKKKTTGTTTLPPFFAQWHIPLFFSRLKRWQRWLLAVFSLNVAWWVGMFILLIIPAPVTTAPPVLKNYQPLTETATATFSAEYNYLSRVDLYFQNIDLRNHDTFSITVTQLASDSAQNAPVEVFNQNFSGFNAGYPSVLRFNIPPQSNSKHTSYQISVTPQTAIDEPLEIGVTHQPPNQMAYMIYYSPPIDVTATFTATTDKIISITSQLPLLYGALAILLWFGL